ncbi:UvrD-helicase domain-containing protein [Candidatus Dojkabacteria bacterium]|nr:UvrD-helicase domain-containing protein [Candidatus Dojkabacteria bacterium]
MDLQTLNDKQKEAVTYFDSPLLVFAGAGSGKTRVIVHKIAYLINELKVSPHNILALTFTKKAAEEMRSRVSQMLNSSVNLKGMFVGTFHSWGAYILRRESQEIGLNQNFPIFDSTDKDNIIKEIIKDFNIGKVSFGAVSAVISRLKSDLISSSDYLKLNFSSPQVELMAKVYDEYEKRKSNMGGVDFDDLLAYPLKLFSENSEILQKYKQTYSYILVDEYQDTNKTQYKLIKNISNENVCVVGDDDQSIYSWRGAIIENILRFKSDFAQAKIIKLDTNYRSTQKIIDAAYGLVANNTKREDKEVFSVSDTGEDLTLYEGDDENDEAFFVISRIQKLLDEGYSFNDIAIFYRTNSQSRVIEEQLVSYGLPYRIYGGYRFYERAEIKDLIGYISFLVDNKDDISLFRILNTPARKIGPSAISKLKEVSSQNGISAKELVRAYIVNSGVALPFGSNTKSLSDKDIKALKFLDKFVEAFREIDFSRFSTLTEFVTTIIETTNYKEYLANKYPELYEEKLENIVQLKHVTEKYGFQNSDLLNFLEEVVLMLDIESESTNKEGAVNLMTLHASKGLEFSVVFIVGIEEGVLPHFRSLESTDAVEEERRLLYVGITRAKRKVFLSYTRFNSARLMSRSPSRFLSEIPEEHLQIIM